MIRFRSRLRVLSLSSAAFLLLLLTLLFLLLHGPHPRVSSSSLPLAPRRVRRSYGRSSSTNRVTQSASHSSLHPLSPFFSPSPDLTPPNSSLLLRAPPTLHLRPISLCNRYGVQQRRCLLADSSPSPSRRLRCFGDHFICRSILRLPIPSCHGSVCFCSWPCRCDSSPREVSICPLWHFPFCCFASSLSSPPILPFLRLSLGVSPLCSLRSRHGDHPSRPLANYSGPGPTPQANYTF